MKAKKIIGKLLLAFVLVSIGFALGKETTAGRSRASAGAAEGTARADGDKVIVYYLHTTFRCATCNRIEDLTDLLLHAEFAAELTDGRVEWRRVDFQKDEDLARRYQVATSVVVVVKVRGGQEVAFDRLDEVWTRVEDRDEFTRYVGAAIRRMLGGQSA